ncbi:MAG: UTP--glucose-1-phosphate uridylyltransferase GalU [Burkholderiales bacterium]|uniref:UTP--glucose-1-phosphate uridylyltransferase GalU n=1 Tax=Nitrosomonas sp. TaxID=42353 RepID=UPI001D733AE1|nr:UTP--glucose-1-phosphate uridylyltransferase GalU [Nitrosomonas sp.]MCB1949221.1 UTP--glucose-1-phosphate uridylyltransferase GalU [Nitrosomonas sp.]MCP5241948.1 UTP--glucose-1-phosphate uridylyltransferase GalU [Burkholderiales bacterium]
MHKKLPRSITKAVFPIAGLGTRFLPVTKASPKEMLPIVDKPLIQYAVEEAYAAGIRQMIFVTGRTKRAIEDHFDTAYELESVLEYSHKQQLLESVRNITPDDMHCMYVRQNRALGLGHAILCAEKLVGNSDFAVILADDFMVAEQPVMAQMVEQYHQLQKSIIAVQDVPRSQTNLYGIVSGSEVKPGLFGMSSIVEKPSPNEAPSTMAVVGRYILTSAIFDELKNQQPGIGGEIQLTDGIANLLRKEQVFSYHFSGTRYDCGSKIGYLKAVVDVACNHPEVSEPFSRWLENKAQSTHTQATKPNPANYIA